MELKSRKAPDPSARLGDESERKVVGRGRKRIVRNRISWDSLLWVFAAFAVLYFTEFASHLLFNDAIHRSALLVSLLSFCICVCCLVHSMYHYPSLSPVNWHIVAPKHVVAATVTFLTGGSSLWFAVWPVWRYYTFLILPTLFMGFISGVSLINI